MARADRPTPSAGTTASTASHSFTPSFWRVWSTQSLSIIGSTLSAIGVAVHVYVATGDTRWLGALAALSAVPYVLVSPLLGRLDRITRRSMLLLGDTVAAIGPAIALVVALVGRLEPWHLALAGFVSGVGNAIQTPAAAAIVPALLPGAPVETLARANGMFQLGPAVGVVVGPALGAMLMVWRGVEAVLVVDLVTFGLAVAATLTTRFGEVTNDVEASDDDGSWASAFRWLRSDGRPVLALIVAMGTVNFLLAAFNVSVMAVASDVGGAGGAGFAFAAGGIAMIAGSFATGISGVARRPVRVFAVALAMVAAGCLVASVRPWFPLVVVGVVLAVAPVSIVNAGVATVFQTRVPATMVARVFAARSTIGRSLDPLGSVLTGLVIAVVARRVIRDGGAGDHSWAVLVGAGDDRAAALVLGVAGVLFAGLAVSVAINRSLAPLDDARPSAAPVVEDRGAANVAETPDLARFT